MFKNPLSAVAVAVVAIIAVTCLSITGCGGDENDVQSNGETTPVFSVAVSEYPSWSTFLVADLKGLIDKDQGKLGTVEKKWGVDIVVRECDYDTCLTLCRGVLAVLRGPVCLSIYLF